MSAVRFRPQAPLVFEKMFLFVKVIPNASKSFMTNEVVEYLGKEYLKVYVSSPPDDGKANGELKKLLASHFGIARSKVQILSGEKSRYKKIELAR